MSKSVQVYELPIEQILFDLKEELAKDGVEVLEQVPAGVWWLKTLNSRQEVINILKHAFQPLFENHLQEIEQT